MSSNTSKGRGEKGSKFWMQMIPNTKLKEQFDQFVGDELRWLSPLKGEKSEYLEYELSHPCICGELEIDAPKTAFEFWPERQPQWDGIAVSDETKTLYLVEAKAHLAEIDSRCSAGEKSKEMISKAMRAVFDQHYGGGDYHARMEDYYQLGNRLTFLHRMKGMNLEKYPNVKLVLLNFVNDYTYRPTEQPDWQNHYRKVFKKMTGQTGVPDDVLVVYYDVGGNWILG